MTSLRIMQGCKGRISLPSCKHRQGPNNQGRLTVSDRGGSLSTHPAVHSAQD